MSDIISMGKENIISDNLIYGQRLIFWIFDHVIKMIFYKCQLC